MNASSILIVHRPLENMALFPKVTEELMSTTVSTTDHKPYLSIDKQEYVYQGSYRSRIQQQFGLI